LNNVILTQFQKIPGVQAAWTFGGPQRQIQVVVDRDKLTAYNLSILDIRKALDAANFDRGGGPLIQGDSQIDVRVPSEFREQSINKDLPKLPVKNIDGRVIYLEDVAEVKDTIAQMYGDFYYNAEPAIWLGIQAEPLRDYRAVADKAKELASLLEREYPGLTFEIVFDKTFYMDLNDSNALFEFFLAVALAGLVMLLFLGELGGTLIAAAILPSTIAFGFFVIHMLGFQKDFGITLGMVFVVGKLLDDSIVVVEVVRREIERGLAPREAAITGAESVQNAITAATFTFVVMLVPMTQMTGDMGSGFLSMTIPMITSVIASLFMALTLTPLMCAYIFKPRVSNDPGAQGDTEELMPSTDPPPGIVGRIIHYGFLRYFHRFESLFARLITWSLNYRWVVMAFMAASLYLTVTLFDLLEQEQMPLTDTSLALGYVRAEPGTSFARMEEIVRSIEINRTDRPQTEERKRHLRANRPVTGLGAIFHRLWCEPG